MKSIYLKNFTATAVLISLGLLLVAVSALGLGRGYVINEYTPYVFGKSSDDIISLV